MRKIRRNLIDEVPQKPRVFSETFVGDICGDEDKAVVKPAFTIQQMKTFPLFPNWLYTLFDEARNTSDF
ncbi:hypothetical protein E5288_WYG014152 [Bos mutus]|uniref:Uncharacterized protein n=1 Tax=Bos mutus TaxID=72004 RepID=A0A6B0R360_9CETA|nr:hypothetical protein [Bos mutus]